MYILMLSGVYLYNPSIHELSDQCAQFRKPFPAIFAFSSPASLTLYIHPSSPSPIAKVQKETAAAGQFTFPSTQSV